MGGTPSSFHLLAPQDGQGVLARIAQGALLSWGPQGREGGEGHQPGWPGGGGHGLGRLGGGRALSCVRVGAGDKGCVGI